MTNKHDTKILNLKKQIEAKKKELGMVARFSPITNCSIEFLDKRFNINTLRKPDLEDLLINLNIVRMSVEQLEIKDYSISGYTIEDWMTDISAKIKTIDHQSEVVKLKQAEAKLDELLSDDKKIELELNEIEGLI